MLAQKHQLVLERIFGLAKAGTDPRTEFVAGMTTFLTMIYIVLVNPQILGNAGMDKGAVFVATCIAAAAWIHLWYGQATSSRYFLAIVLLIARTGGWDQ